MKHLTRDFLLIALFITKIGFSQQPTIDSYKPVIEKVITYFNDKDYTSFYNLLSTEFKDVVTSMQIEQFLKSTQTQCGNFKNTFLISDINGLKKYKAEFENNSLEMYLACNNAFQISGLRFKPYKEPVLEKKIFQSDNKKLTLLDLKVDSIVTEYMQNPINAGLSVGIIQNGVTIFYHYGETNKESKKTPNNATIYEIGSISKTFTGLLLAKAIEDKKIKLDDDIRKYLPALCNKLGYNNTPITINHLVTHTSRIPRVPENLEQQLSYDSLNPYKNYTKELVYQYLSTLQLDTIPGVIQEYSNTGMALLGIILEKVYNQSYESLIATYITIPLKMNNTLLNVLKLQKINFATGYDSKGLETPHWDLNDFAGAGGIKSTISDMTLFLNENLNETISYVRKSHTTLFKNTNKQATAFAWHKEPTKNGNTMIWHNGGTAGFTSFIGIIPNKKCGIVVLSNSGNGVDEIALDILRYVQY